MAGGGQETQKQGLTTNTGSGSVYGGMPIGGMAQQPPQQSGPFGNVYSPPPPTPFGAQPTQQPFNGVQDPSPFMQQPNQSGGLSLPSSMPPPQQNGGIASLGGQGAIGMGGQDQSFIVHGQPVQNNQTPMNQTQPYGQGIGQPNNMPFTDSTNYFSDSGSY
jgi:hypothetical protein